MKGNIRDSIKSRQSKSHEDKDLEKIFSTRAQKGILQAFALQAARFRLKTCKCCLMVGTKEKYVVNYFSRTVNLSSYISNAFLNFMLLKLKEISLRTRNLESYNCSCCSQKFLKRTS